LSKAGKKRSRGIEDRQTQSQERHGRGPGASGPAHGFLDRNKANWDLGDFNFSATLSQVSTILANEINLESEQNNIDRAGRHFETTKRWWFPKGLRFPLRA
jgi:hypothetical protein